MVPPATSSTSRRRNSTGGYSYTSSPHSPLPPVEPPPEGLPLSEPPPEDVSVGFSSSSMVPSSLEMTRFTMLPLRSEQVMLMLVFLSSQVQLSNTYHSATLTTATFPTAAACRGFDDSACTPTPRDLLSSHWQLRLHFIWKGSQPFIYNICAPRGTRTGQCPE